MACTSEFIEFICDMLTPLGEVRSRKMMGDYVIYVNEKCVITACDNIAYVKKLPCIAPLMADVQPETPVHTLLSIALRGDTDDIKWISRIIEEYAAKGNIESRNALPALKERIKAASKTARQATADILKEHGVVSKADMQRLSDEDSALLYEALKAGVIEEYGISHKRLDKLIGEILK